MDQDQEEFEYIDRLEKKNAALLRVAEAANNRKATAIELDAALDAWRELEEK